MAIGLKINQSSNHKAVAPIIATLLMVAIAVVGGILIFVFTQGFFADEQAVGPTVDNIRIVGYNATDNAENVIGTADSSKVVDCGGGGGNPMNQDGVLDDGECITIFLENLGDKPVAIQSVRLFGQTYTDSNGNGDCGENDSDEGTFTIIDQTATETGYSVYPATAVVSVIDPNQLVTLCVSYDDTTTKEVKVGRHIPVQVETANGQSSQINVINGAVRGAQ